MSVITTVNKVIENLAHFLSPYLQDILASVSNQTTNIHELMFSIIIEREAPCKNVHKKKQIVFAR